MLHAAFLMPLLPLAGFVVLAAFGRRLGDPGAGWLATTTVAGSFVVSCIVTAGLMGRAPGPAREYTQVLYNWIPVGGFQAKAALLVDPLSMTMALFVTGVSALIHLYSVGYMRRDEDFPKYFAYLNLFVAFMLLLVLADNFLFTFVGWEGVGLCSYWLVAYWFGRDSAASAGKKAFLYNRVGDVGFLIAMFLVFSRTGTLNYLGVFAHRAAFGSAAATAACLLLFLAATGKSAQIPLFPWLPDAMEGPTPVSALIHAATMVTAGVYLMCRISPLLALSSNAQLVVAIIGAATALVAATIACAQDDIKKVLAYSTVSQLGYMFLAVGTGAYEAAIFLMVAHAFFKALLFMGSGSVIHALGDEQDLKKMGGLARWMWLTAVTFAVGALAIAGIPPLSGFWAKGNVLDDTFARHPALWVVALVTALLTAYYITRLYLLCFTGDERWRQAVEVGGHHDAVALTGASAAAPAPGHGGLPPDAGHGLPHDPGPPMAVPLVVLAFAAIVGGVLSLPWHSGFTAPLSWLGPVFGHNLYAAHQSAATLWSLGLVDAAVAATGLVIGWALWRQRAARAELEPTVLVRKWYLDELYDALFGRPGEALAHFAVVDIDNKVIDGAVNGVGRLARVTGGALRRVQTGFVRQYALALVLGLVVLVAYMAARSL